MISLIEYRSHSVIEMEKLLTSTSIYSLNLTFHLIGEWASLQALKNVVVFQQMMAVAIGTKK